MALLVAASWLGDPWAPQGLSMGQNLVAQVQLSPMYPRCGLRIVPGDGEPRGLWASTGTRLAGPATWSPQREASGSERCAVS